MRDAARVLGYPYGVGDKIAKAMPPLVMGRDTPLKYCFEQIPKYADGYKAASELRAMYDADPDVKRVVDVAKGLEGLKRSDGIHAAAVVITKEPLTSYLPMQRKPEAGGRPEDAPVVTQYEMHGVEELGLLKMDFLGLRNLDVITDTDGHGARRQGSRSSTSTPFRSTTRRCSTSSAAATRWVCSSSSRRRCGPCCARSRRPASTTSRAVIALYRPGPMSVNMHYDYADRKNGRQAVSYFHEDAEEVLGDTYGLMIYQESVMRVAQKFAGYSLAEADNLRKAMGKKSARSWPRSGRRSRPAPNATGYGQALGKQLFDVIEKFADYAFNKSHTFGYGLVTYQTAYLKAHYPVEYFACLLTSVKSNLDKAAVYLSGRAGDAGIKVLTPDINRSVMDFATVAPEEIADQVTLPPARRGDHVRAVGGAQRR